MAEYDIEIYENSIFGDFYNQPIPSDYYNFLNDGNDNDNNTPGTLVDNVLLDNKRVEDAVYKIMMTALPKTLTPSKI